MRLRRYTPEEKTIELDPSKWEDEALFQDDVLRSMESRLIYLGSIKIELEVESAVAFYKANVLLQEFAKQQSLKTKKKGVLVAKVSYESYYYRMIGDRYCLREADYASASTIYFHGKVEYWDCYKQQWAWSDIWDQFIDHGPVANAYVSFLEANNFSIADCDKCYGYKSL